MMSWKTRGVVKADACVRCAVMQAGVPQWRWLVEAVREE
jgi:hypothetical protein